MMTAKKICRLLKIFKKCPAWSAGITWACVLVVTPALSRAQVAESSESKTQQEAVQLATPGLTTGVRVSPSGRVDALHVVDRPIAEVLRLLSVQSHRNIIPSPNVQGNVTANLFDLSFEEALAAILKMNGAGYRIAGKFVYVYTNEELAKLNSDRRGSRETRVFRLSYISATDATAMLAQVLEEGDKIVASPTTASGVSSTPDDAGGVNSATTDFVIVTAYPTTLDKVADLLKELDIRPKQVLIEATILRASLSDDNALGIDFSIVGGVDLQQLSATSNGVLDLTVGQLPDSRLQRFNAAAQTNFTSDVPSGGVSVGIIKDKVGVFLKALEQVTDTTVLANPKVLALNKQKGQIIVGRRDGFLTTTVTQTQAIQTVKFLETGTQLIFRPIIGDDGFIRVELHPEDSVGFVNAEGLPTEQTTEVTTNIIVRDGRTILIGGLFREVTTDTRNQIPLLGTIPGIGQFFRSRNDNTAREEVVILLTLHIVKDRAAFAEASRKEFEDVERNRIGLRHGLMWHGRERLAQSHYRKALDAFKAGDQAKALWHTDMALHSYGRFVPAMKLKERLLGERLWDEDGSDIRSFVHQLIARERHDEASFLSRGVLEPPQSVETPNISSTKEDQPQP